VAIFCLGGYFFGNIPFVKENFTAVILGIIFVSLIPAIAAFLRSGDEATKAA
jgi:membrane-associated protein